MLMSPVRDEFIVAPSPAPEAVSERFTLGKITG